MNTSNGPATLALQVAPWPQVNFAQFGEVEVVPVSRIQALTSTYLSRNSLVIPHVTHHDELDITGLDVHRRAPREGGPKLTLLPFVVRALADLLREFPRFNASLSLEGDRLVLKKYSHVGVAIDTPNGLLVGVVREADQKSVEALAEEISTLSTRAREKGLPMRDMVGGCISVSSLGHIGGTAFTPIINAPEVAIVGLTKARWQATKDDDGALVWRLMLPVSLSYDHRVINGADAARFTAALGRRLAAFAA